MPERVDRNSSYLNGKSSSGTTTRVRDVSPTSGMCPLCISECPVLCEIGFSSLRGREALYPESTQFGTSTAAALKDYGLDWSDLNMLSRLFAEGNSTAYEGFLPFSIDVSTTLAGVDLKIPLIVGAYGSTEVARRNWESLAIGAAISGTIITVGENVCGMDSSSTFSAGRITHSGEMQRRIEAFRRFWDSKHGDISVQTNVEDQSIGVDEYVLSQLEVDIIERKLGQGAKAIGGEVRIRSIETARLLKSRGYLVVPDPDDDTVSEAFRNGYLRSFERHSRLPNLREFNFSEDVERLRAKGAKKIALKTGSYRPSSVAFTMKQASEAKVDYVIFDGAGGGTGMSPVSMMDEMGLPTVYLECEVLRCASMLDRKGRHVPDIVMAGGFIDESQVVKAIGLSNFTGTPYVKAIQMGRAPITAVFKASYYANLAEKGQLPKNFVEAYGAKPEHFFSAYEELKEAYGERASDLTWGAIGFYSYVTSRIGTGLQQLTAGTRKRAVASICRDDLVSLSERSAKVTGILLPEEIDLQAVADILDL